MDKSKCFEKIMANFYGKNLPNVIDRTDAEKKENTGMPDIEIADNLYIECTLANKGEDGDGVTWECPKWTGKESERAMHCVPDEVVQARNDFIFRRFASRLFEKNEKFVKNEKRLNNKLPRIVAISIDLEGLNHVYFRKDIYEDMFRKLLWDNGRGVTMQSFDGGWRQLPYKDGKVIRSPRNKEEIGSGIFADVEFNFSKISAVLFVYPSSVRETVKQGTSIGINDMFLCVNQFAENQITERDWAELLCPLILMEHPKSVSGE